MSVNDRSIEQKAEEELAKTMSYNTKSFSTDVLTKAIEKYLREKVSKKIRKRKENGWEEVHAEMKSCELSENIRNLPSELREKILKHLIEIKVNEKKKMGWEDVHEDIKSLPYCEIQGQVTKVFVCNKCNNSKVPGLCVACYENETCQECKPHKSKEFCMGCYENKTKYHKLVSREEAYDQQEKGNARIWETKKQISESPKEKKERAENIKMIRLQMFIDKLSKEYLEQKAEKRRKKAEKRSKKERKLLAEKCVDTLP
jgi:hypothetical protein